MQITKTFATIWAVSWNKNIRYYLEQQQGKEAEIVARWQPIIQFPSQVLAEQSKAFPIMEALAAWFLKQSETSASFQLVSSQMSVLFPVIARLSSRGASQDLLIEAVSDYFLFLAGHQDEYAGFPRIVDIEQELVSRYLHSLLPLPADE